MEHPQHWTEEQVAEFERSLRSHPVFGQHVPNNNLEDEFRGKGWFPEEASEMAKYVRWLSLLPFPDARLGIKILTFYYTKFRRIQSRFDQDPDGQQLCKLYEILGRMIFQGTSVFPRRSAELAIALQEALHEYPRYNVVFDALASLLVDPADGSFRHGFNSDELTREEVNATITAEYVNKANNYEDYYEAREKYDQYVGRLRESTEFREDWEALKAKFPLDTRAGEIKRSDLGSPIRAIPYRAVGRFQDVFDFFCWKWFLEGMSGDEPLVQKLTFKLSPFGTEIFIPGYWNLDYRRDIKWKELLKFHRARGIARQGKILEANRQEREARGRLFIETERRCRAKGLSSAEMVQECIKAARMAPNTDPAYIYRILREAKRTQEKQEQTSQTNRSKKKAKL